MEIDNLGVNCWRKGYFVKDGLVAVLVGRGIPNVSWNCGERVKGAEGCRVGRKKKFSTWSLVFTLAESSQNFNRYIWKRGLPFLLFGSRCYDCLRVAAEFSWLIFKIFCFVELSTKSWGLTTSFIVSLVVHSRRLQALKALTYAPSSSSDILSKLYDIVFSILDKVCLLLIFTLLPMY